MYSPEYIEYLKSFDYRERLMNEQPKIEKRGRKRGRQSDLTRAMSDEEYKQYYVFLQARNQARYRKEGWTIEWEDYKRIWGDRFHLRGRSSDSLSFARLDQDLPWTPDNVAIKSRSECRVQASRRTKWGSKKKTK